MAKMNGTKTLANTGFALVGGLCGQKHLSS